MEDTEANSLRLMLGFWSSDRASEPSSVRREENLAIQDFQQPDTVRAQEGAYPGGVLRRRLSLRATCSKAQGQLHRQDRPLGV